jgi:uncharacterized protein YdhG (YjbR/CyaY superfamily)
MAALPDDRRSALTRLRKLCKTTLVGSKEAMQFGMPCYQRNGQTLVAFASQKQHISLYICQPEVVDAYRAELGKLSAGKGCIRFVRTEQMDFDLLGKILATVKVPAAAPTS